MKEVKYRYTAFVKLFAFYTYLIIDYFEITAKSFQILKWDVLSYFVMQLNLYIYFTSQVNYNNGLEQEIEMAS